MEDRWARLLDMLLKNKGRVFGTVLGIVTGALVIKYGWLQAVYFIFCVGTGYYLGKRVDSRESLVQLLKKVFPAQKEK